MLDACHPFNPSSNKIPFDDKTTIIGSSQEGESSYENDAWKNGAFTEIVLQGLSGKADFNQNHIITISELYGYLCQKLPPLVKKEINQTQTPIFINNSFEEIPIIDY